VFELTVLIIARFSAAFHITGLDRRCLRTGCWREYLDGWRGGRLEKISWWGAS